MDINTDEPLKTLKAQILEYIELKTEYARLSSIEYIAKVASYLFAAIIGIIIISLVVLSIFISLLAYLHFLRFIFSFLAEVNCTTSILLNTLPYPCTSSPRATYFF